MAQRCLRCQSLQRVRMAHMSNDKKNHFQEVTKMDHDKEFYEECDRVTRALLAIFNLNRTCPDMIATCMCRYLGVLLIRQDDPDLAFEKVVRTIRQCLDLKIEEANAAEPE